MRFNLSLYGQRRRKVAVIFFQLYKDRHEMTRNTDIKQCGETAENLVERDRTPVDIRTLNT
jgi:hypothetical protein